MSAPAILIFDTETTGTDKDRDQIIELSVQQGLADNSLQDTWRIKPDVPITVNFQWTR